MAIQNNAIKVLADSLHDKMTGDDPLSSQEQTLVATAIDKLAASNDWEHALVGVAGQHLDQAALAVSNQLGAATSTLTTSEADINQALSAVQAQSVNLGLIPQLNHDVQTALSGFGQANDDQLSYDLASMVRPISGLINLAEWSQDTDHQTALTAFTVYDASGETFLVRPSLAATAAQTQENQLEYFSLAADGMSKTVLQSHFVDGTNFHATPTTYIYQYGASAILPLATRADSNDIAYEVVYSSQNAATNGSTEYAGIYCRSSGDGTVIKPKLNVDGTDQWGISSVTNHIWSDVGVLYDNQKHCLVIVDESSSFIVEKYRDGNVVTTINIADSAALQSYVNSRDFTTVKLIANNFILPHGHFRVKATESALTHSNQLDCYGFYGKLGDKLKMGGDKYNAHYRFTVDKKLEPINFFFASTVNQNTEAGIYGAEGGVGDLFVSLTDMLGNTLGVYHYQSKADAPGYPAGYMATALMCINPYSHIGLLYDLVNYNTASAVHYGMIRSCKAFS
jgi:hypothetical protein